MKKQNKNQEKQMKVAEAGILFVLVLGLTIFLGVHFSGQDDDINTLADNGQTEASAIEVVQIEPGLVDASASEIDFTPVVEDTTPVIEEVITPEPRVVTYAMAEEAYRSKDYTLASDFFNQYTDEHPENAWGFYMLGLSQWKAGEADVAEESFLAALDLKPDHQKSLVNYGRVLIELDRASEAREQIEIALAVNPENNSARRVLGRILHNEGQLENAAATYEVILRTQTEDAWALNNLGLIRIEQGMFETAVAPLAKAASLKSDVACIQNNLGVALERIGQIDAAGEAFAAALVADANYEKAEISLARLENLIQDESLETVDLAALAAEFMVPALDEPVAEDMEVAAAGDLITSLEMAISEAVEEIEKVEEPSTAEIVEPEADGHRNR